nr:MAG TPA: hypothetical protein [Bacteriophage sp.]DAV90671.1 MAG TPA: hypothetical protein [Caudoviricetes sp.]
MVELCGCYARSGLEGAYAFSAGTVGRFGVNGTCQKA